MVMENLCGLIAGNIKGFGKMGNSMGGFFFKKDYFGFFFKR